MDDKKLAKLKEDVLTHIESEDIERLKSVLSQAEDIEVSYIISDLSSKEKALVFRLLKKDIALLVFERLDTVLQQELIRSFTDEKVIKIIEELTPDTRVRLLEEMPAGVAKKMISSLSREERQITNTLMGYEAETAGRIMTTEYISLQRKMDVDGALRKVRSQAKDKETIYTLYITDRAKKLKGVLSLKDLLIAEPGDKIEDIMSESVLKVSTDTDQEEVAKALKEFDLLAIPVVDKEDRLVGIVTIDDAIDILEEEATEDIYDQAGLADVTGRETNRSEVLINGNLWQIWKVRLPFLIITLGAGMVSGTIIGGFEQALESIAVVAIFIPLIMDMGGTVGTQSSTLFVRGVMLGHIRLKNFLRHFFKEIGVGFSIGAIAGIVTGTIATIWQGMPLLGLAVGLALVTTMTLAALLGFFVPFLLIKLNVDQAVGSTPIITAVKDIMGLTIYFIVVSNLLRGLM